MKDGQRVSMWSIAVATASRRESLARSRHPVLERRDQREAPLLAGRQAFGGGRAVDLALAVEERVDTSDGLQRDRRDRRRRLAPSSVGGDISQLEEFPPRVAPAQRLDDRTRRPVGKIEAIVAVTGGLALEPHVSAISGSRSRVHRNDA